MKKYISVLLSIALLMTLLTVASMTANAETSGDFEYEILEDGTAEITAYCGSASELSIPKEINGYPVTSIAEWALSECESLTSVTIPDSVTCIGDDAFAYCTSLTSVTIPDSVTCIGDEAFAECTCLISVTIPDSVTSIGVDAFWSTAWYDDQPDGPVYTGKMLYVIKGDCPETVEIKEGTLGIVGYAFSYCTSLTSVDIPDSVMSIGFAAFIGCTGLTEIALPKSLTVIDDLAFFHCTAMKTISIPKTVTHIGDMAIGKESVLSMITSKAARNIEGFTIKGYVGSAAEQYAIDNGIQFFDNDFRYSTVDTASGESEVWITGYWGISTDVTIPAYVDGAPIVAVMKGVFRDFMKEIRFPDTLKSIASDSLEITEWFNNQPDGVVYAGNIAYVYKGALEDCPSVLELKQGTVTIGDNAFQDCKALQEITFPDSLSSIGYNAFVGCDSLTGVVIPRAVESIGSKALGYKSWYNGEKYDNFTIYGYEGSAAEAYASENGFTFVALDDNKETILGDTDGDGDVTILDATAVQRTLADLPTQSYNEKAADADEDGEVTILDATSIQRYLADLSTNPNIGKPLA